MQTKRGVLPDAVRSDVLAWDGVVSAEVAGVMQVAREEANNRRSQCIELYDLCMGLTAAVAHLQGIEFDEDFDARR